MDKKLFSERLATRRKEKGYATQRDFARAYDIKFPPKRRDETNGSDWGFLGTLKNYESGGDKCNPKLQNVINICALLDCSVDYLLGNISQPKHEQKFVCDYTGLSLDSVITLHQMTQKEDNIKNISYKFLNTVLDWILLDDLAINCENYNQNRFKNKTLYINDDQGQCIGLLYDSDTALLLAQNRFKELLEFMGNSGKEHEFFSHAAYRKELNKFHMDDIAEHMET